MSSTTFAAGITIPSTWLNDVNGVVWTVFNGATTPALARTALGLTASDGSSLIGYLTSGTGATATTVQAKLREQLSVKDFGAVGDGTTDDSAAFQAAITAAAVIGTSVFVPSTVNGYYMGTTGLTITSYVALVGSHKSVLKWSASFTGTAITLSGSYNRLENLILSKPTQAGAVDTGIIAVDSQGPLNVFEDLEIRVSGALANNGWYTGIKIQGIESTIRRCGIYAYDIAVLYSHVGSNSDLSIEDSVIVAQVTAAVKTINASSISIVDCDIEGGTTALHGVWINTTTVVSAGINISGTIIVNCVTDGIFLDANASFPVEGVSITGNQIYGITTSAVSLSNVVGVSISGNYLAATTNWLKVQNTVSGFQEGGNLKSGAVSISGTFLPDLYSEEMSVTSPTGLQFGGSTTGITYSTNTLRWKKVGKHVSGFITLVLTSKGAQTGAATISLAGLPSATKDGIVKQLYHANYATSFVFEGYVGSGTALITLGKGNNATFANLAETDFNNNTTVEIFFEYEVA